MAELPNQLPNSTTTFGWIVLTILCRYQARLPPKKPLRLVGNGSTERYGSGSLSAAQVSTKRFVKKRIFIFIFSLSFELLLLSYREGIKFKKNGAGG
jgi:hypothetical protein